MQPYDLKTAARLKIFAVPFKVLKDPRGSTFPQHHRFSNIRADDGLFYFSFSLHFLFMSEPNTDFFKPIFKFLINYQTGHLKAEDLDYTQGSIRKAVILLAIPMMLEMAMESVFALVDLYFVGHLHNSSHAIQTVGLTESVLTIIYSLAIGMSMAATAVVASAGLAKKILKPLPEQACKPL